jgi:hypothetical protein
MSERRHDPNGEMDPVVRAWYGWGVASRPWPFLRPACRRLRPRPRRIQVAHRLGTRLPVGVKLGDVGQRHLHDFQLPGST